MSNTGKSVYSERIHFFGKQQSHPFAEGVVCIVVTHLLPDRIALIPAISKLVTIGAILAIPYSLDTTTQDQLKDEYLIFTPRLAELRDPEYLTNLVLEVSGDNKVILMDIGGYFAAAHDSLAALFGERLIGIVEDTEAGHRSYEALQSPKVPIISVARSDLKAPEDNLVGKSVAYSIEKALRERDAIISSMHCLILGYGKVGKGVASAMHAQNYRVTVYDIDPKKRIEALSHGFGSPERSPAIAAAQLIIGATGCNSVLPEDIPILQDGCWLISASSKDVEFPIDFMMRTSDYRTSSDHVTLLSFQGKKVALFAEGRPLNFVDGAAMGEFIGVVQAELLASIRYLLNASPPNGLNELPTDIKDEIALAWCDAFVCPNTGTLKVCM